MDCRVVVEAAVPVYDVSTEDEAVRIAISKTGAMLNPDLNYVEINMGERACPHCHESIDPAFIAADESLVALELEMKVFNVEREEHASRIARKEIGTQLENIPLEVLSIEVIDDEDEATEEEEATDDDVTGDDESQVVEHEADTADEPDVETAHESGDAGSAADDEDVLPEFEDLIE
ncbi:DUF555 domain-containing protein [Halorubellus sp. PRR65]|uniref:DUF555 domain-containing protein n=1 Tax=Halorubellus sp. PRR65 TaxID=3098148 RepID=UPI002B259056|nr:DUF555 domain-containing protein [Halorubellus sp. PRR65]